MPGFRKTPEEVERFERMLAPFRFISDGLSIEFKTTWEFSRWVVPPCLEPVGNRAKNTADGIVAIERCQSPHGGEGNYSVVALICRYKDVEGPFLISQVVEGDMWAVRGREIWGEIKKVGRGRLFRDGTHYYGCGERKGVRIVEIEAEITGPELAPKVVEQEYQFDVKMYPHSDPLRGLQYPPLLNIHDVRREYTSLREGTGTLKWGHSQWDPTDTIPLVEVGIARAEQDANYYSLGQQVELEDPDDVYKQYLWGRAYDDLRWQYIPTRWQGAEEFNADPVEDAETLG